MISDLIPFCDLERAYLRESMAMFARQHPEAAARLGAASDTPADPHVNRLVEAVAMLNARLRHKIEDEFPEISDALLFSLYPQLISPLPSFFVARLIPSPDIAGPVHVPRGTMIETEKIEGEVCRYQLAADTLLLPIRIARAAIRRPGTGWPEHAPREASGALCISLAGTSPEVDFGKLPLARLRFYLRSDPRVAHILTEQFGVNLLGIGVACGTSDRDAVLLDPEALRNVGLDRDGALLPQPDPGLGPYALLQEYFAYPHKHLFYELSGLDACAARSGSNQLDLFFYFDRVSAQVEQIVTAEDFELFAAPAINLFELDTEAVEIDHRSHEYRVSPGSGHEHGHEIHSVLGVDLLQNSDNEIQRPIRPLYSIDHSGTLSDLYYTVQRRESFAAHGGDDVFLSFADLKNKLVTKNEMLALPRILVTNRGLPNKLGSKPKLTVTDNINGVEGIEAITKPTATRYPFRRRKILWRLISQLSLNHLSLSGDDEGAALKEMLRLYDPSGPDGDAGALSRLHIVAASTDLARLIVAGHVAMCAGTHVQLDVGDERLAGNGTFMLCAVIERFLSGLASINSFVRVSARLRSGEEEWKSWPAEAGKRWLL